MEVGSTELSSVQHPVPSVFATRTRRERGWLLISILLIMFACDGRLAVPGLVRVDAIVERGLDPTSACRAKAHAAPWSRDEPNVYATRWEDGRLFLAIHRDVGNNHVEKLELWLAIDKLPVRAEAAAYWYEECDRRSSFVDATAQGLHGMVKLSEAGFPRGNQPLIVAYHLEGSSAGRAVAFDGKLAVSALDVKNE